ncbi:hypothetical protein GCM10023080_080140 [Streptomyces pseudoechinosporeus]
MIRYRVGQAEVGEDTHGFLIESNGTGPGFDVCGSIECLDPETKVVSQVRGRGADRAKAHDHYISVNYVGHVRTFPDRNQLWQGVELSVGLSGAAFPPPACAMARARSAPAFGRSESPVGHRVNAPAASPSAVEAQRRCEIRANQPRPV